MSVKYPASTLTSAKSLCLQLRRRHPFAILGGESTGALRLLLLGVLGAFIFLLLGVLIASTVGLAPVIALPPCALDLALVLLAHLGAFVAWGDGVKLILGALAGAALVLGSFAGAALVGFAAKGERSTTSSVYLSICKVRYTVQGTAAC
jgi:hypothetical protein